MSPFGAAAGQVSPPVGLIGVFAGSGGGEAAGAGERGQVAGQGDLVGDAAADLFRVDVGGQLLLQLGLAKRTVSAACQAAAAARSFSSRAIRSIRAASLTWPGTAARAWATAALHSASTVGRNRVRRLDHP